MSSLDVNVEMIAVARKAREISQSTLAEQLSISQGKLSKIENGLLKVDLPLLGKMAKYLDFPIQFFFERRWIFDPIDVSPRKRASLKQSTFERLVATLNLRSLQISKLFSNIEFAGRPLPLIEVDPEEQSPSDIARAIRRLWEIPCGPIANLVALIEDAGVPVLIEDFKDPKLDGISINVPKERPIILLNKQFPADRLRFTLAHELGHLIMHRLPSSAMEEEANLFAGEFLLPELEIREQLAGLTLHRLLELKLRWKVSMQALLMRASILNAITEQESKTLWQVLSVRGLRKNEPGEPPGESPTLVRELIDLHRHQLDYSEAELCKLMRITEQDFRVAFGETEKLNLKLVYSRT